MDLALTLSHLWRRRGWLIVVAIVAIFAGVFATHRISSVIPPGLESRELEYGAANLSLVVDSQDSNVAPRDTPIMMIAQRAALYAQLLKSQPVREEISEKTGIPLREIAVDGQTGDQGLTDEANEPGEVQRSAELTKEDSSTLLYFTVNNGYPIINIYAQAPTVPEAVNMVSVASEALSKYVSELQDKLQVPPFNQAKMVQLGEPQGGTVAPGAALGVALAVALATFLAGCLLILFVPRLVHAVREAGEDWDQFPPAPEVNLDQRDRDKAGEDSSRDAERDREPWPAHDPTFRR